MIKHKLIPVFILLIFLFLNSFSLSVYADELRVGSVKGLPERLVVLDDKGQSVNENGEYFFNVENMEQGEVYIKNVQIMNLREDASYVISFMAQPLEKHGDIDLEEECVCDIYIDDERIYKGKVTGDGIPDIRVDPVSLGKYTPGESHAMRIEILWKGPGADNEIDEGAKLVDNSGTTIIRESSGKRHIEGEIKFKWLFFADVIDTSESESQPDTSDPAPGDPGIPGIIKTGETIAFFVIGLVMAATLILIVLLFKKKKNNNDQEKPEP